MNFPVRINRILDHKLRASRHDRVGPAGASRSRRRSRLLLEPLENRLVPASFVVTNLADSGAGTLRDAIDQANVSTDASSTITFQSGLSGNIELITAENDSASLGPSFFVIDKDITIDGPTGTGSQITLDNDVASQQGATSRFFTVGAGASLTLEDLTLNGGLAVGGNGGNASNSNGTGGGAAGLGGAILNYEGTLDLMDDTFENNAALGGNGGSPVAGQGDIGGGGGGMGGSATSGDEDGDTLDEPVSGGPNGGGSGISAGNNGSTATGLGGGGGGGAMIFSGGGGQGGTGGFGGGGGGGGQGSEGGSGGVGGFGGGGGGGGGGTAFNSYGGTPGYGGGPGSSGNDMVSGGGGGGAGMGGAVFSESGDLAISNCTFYDNSATGGYSYNNNSGSGLGGAVFAHNGTLLVQNATFVGNTAQVGAGIYDVATNGVTNAVFELDNSLFDDAPDPDVTVTTPDGTVATLSGTSNLFSSAASTASFFTDSIVTTSPGIGSFGFHGGPTPTIPLLPGSPAIGQADPTYVPGSSDQRGYPRNPVTPDIGADELQPPSIQVVAGSGQTIFEGTGPAEPLQVEALLDDAPEPDVTVAFTAPFSVNILTDSPVAAASFAGSMFAEATTNAQGIATAPTLTANGVAGSYSVEASTAIDGVSLGPVSFTETNAVPRPPTAAAGGPYTIAHGQALTLNASGSSDPNGLALTYTWTINGHADAATGIEPTLTWAQLQALGLGAGGYSGAISVQVTDAAALSATATTPLTITDTTPTVSISGLPSGSTPDHAPVVLTSSVNDSNPAATNFGNVWSVSSGPGQAVVAGEDLTFNGSTVINLPSGLIADASTLTVEVTFQTTSDGVILGYQNEPTSSTPNQYMPALYVGTNGLLYAEIYDGTFREMVSSTPVNNGQEYTAELIETGSSQSLYLDGTLVETLSGTPNPLSMTVDQLGTGYTLGHPNAPSGYLPFTGTIDSLTITAGTALAGSVALSGSSGNQMTFTPPATGTYSVGLAVTDPFGNTGTSTGTVNAVNPITITLPTAPIEATQGEAFSFSGTVTDTAIIGVSYATTDMNVQYGDGTGGRVGGTFVTSFMLSHAYVNAGDYTVTVNFSDSVGNTVSETFEVIVNGFTVNNSSTQPSAVTSLTYTFANPATVKPGAFELLKNGRPSHIKLALDEYPNQQNFVITFSGRGVVDGALPDGDYTLITLHKKVTVLSGPAMTKNDVNKFVARSGDPSSRKKDIRTSHKRSKALLGPPRKAPAKFPGRTVLGNSAIRRASSGEDSAGTLAVAADDDLTAVAIGVLSPRKLGSQ